jgi:hypothetical protein
MLTTSLNWLIANSNANCPKRPTQNDFGGGVRPNGTTGNFRVAAFGRKPPSKIPSHLRRSAEPPLRHQFL